MAIGRMHHVVLDCPDPRALATFYSQLLGLPISHDSDDWVVIASADRHSGMAFQLAPDHQPPVFGDPSRPQQWHLDVMVDDQDIADQAVRRLGATRLSAIGAGEEIYADPAGHPFCLINRPGWAPPVSP